MFSSTPVPEGILPFAQADKIIHAVEYAVLGILLMRAFANSAPDMSFYKCAILSVAAAALYGASDELHQFFVAARDASAWDLLFDGIGAFLGAILYKKRQIARC